MRKTKPKAKPGESWVPIHTKDGIRYVLDIGNATKEEARAALHASGYGAWSRLIMGKDG